MLCWMEGDMTEQETLGRILDRDRAVVAWKVTGLSFERAIWSPVDSGTSALGVLKHLSHVERWWFHAVMGGLDVDFPWSDEDPDADWRIEANDSVESVLELYANVCERSREILAVERDWGRLVEFGSKKRSVRWIVVHMIEETARHAGHLDLLREMIDGETGDFPG